MWSGGWTRAARSTVWTVHCPTLQGPLRRRSSRRGTTTRASRARKWGTGCTRTSTAQEGWRTRRGPSTVTPPQEQF
eukprot:6153782-Alexandrium_andersonii.AAC.1